MHITSDEMPQRMQHLKAGLKRAGIKLTHQRLEICREIAGATNHPDVETVFNGVRARVPTLALDTVYRTLALLVELGLIEKLGTAQETMRFDGNMTQHHHFVCTRCGATHDFYSGQLDQLSLPDDVHAIGQVHKVQVEVRGICQRCAHDDWSCTARAQPK